MKVLFNNLMACLVLLVGSYLMLPINLLLPSRFVLKKAFFPVVSSKWQKDVIKYNGTSPGDFLGHPVNVSVGPLGFPVVIEAPGIASPFDAALELDRWFANNEEWVNKALHEYGGVLVRGVPITTPQQFDRVVAGIHKDSEGTGLYLGTAPRTKIPGTRFTSSASEVVASATIPTHLELCYTPAPPARLYFFAEKPNSPPGGQTPL
eukprot:gene38661-46998_t